VSPESFRGQGRFRKLLDAYESDTVDTVEAEVLTVPALLRSDSSGAVTYACDVKLHIKALFFEAEHIVRNVPVAQTERGYLYCEPGAMVLLRRVGPSGSPYQVVGPAKVGPGHHHAVPVDMETGTAGTAVDWSLTSRPITLEELGDPGFAGDSFGVTPLGARAIFRGSTLLEVR